MTYDSIGPHRAFMGVCITACLCLGLALFMGWQWYFEELGKRAMLIEMAAKAEAKSRELESMGLSLDVGRAAPAPVPLPMPAPVPVSPVERPTGGGVPLVKTEPAPGGTEARPQVPGPPRVSQIQSLPLLEGSAEVVTALELLGQYWKTESWKERVSMVFDPDRVSALMKNYYETQQGADPIPGALVGKAKYEIDGTEILYFSYASSRPTGSLEVAMRRGPEGRFLVDWESLVGYGEMSFRDFRAGRPVKPIMLRAYVRRFEYFNFEFSDSSKYLCVKLTSESGDDSIYGFALRSSRLGQWLESDLAATGPAGFKGYTVRVSFPANSQSNQCVLLDEVVESRWLILP